MSEFSLDNVNSMYMDVLKEIGNIGAGNATTAIAGMLGTTMKMECDKAWRSHMSGGRDNSGYIS